MFIVYNDLLIKFSKQRSEKTICTLGVTRELFRLTFVHVLESVVNSGKAHLAQRRRVCTLANDGPRGSVGAAAVKT